MLTIKTPERCQWRRSGVFIVNFEHISHLVIVFLLLIVNCRLGDQLYLAPSFWLFFSRSVSESTFLTQAQLEGEGGGGWHFKTCWFNFKMPHDLLYHFLLFTWCNNNMIKKLFMVVANRVSIFEFESCFSSAIESLKSFEYEIPIYRDLSSNEIIVRLHLFGCCNVGTMKRTKL